MKFLLVFLIVSIGLPAHAGTVSGIPIIADADTVEFLPEKKTSAPLRHGRALSQRAVKDVGQGQEPGKRGGAPGARGGVALTLPSDHQVHELASST